MNPDVSNFTFSETELEDVAQLAACLYNAPVVFVKLEDAETGDVSYVLGGNNNSIEYFDCFYKLTIASTELSIIEDASLDPRFAEEHLVEGDAALRFYFGAPLIASSGAIVGAIGVFDTAPRTCVDSQSAALQALARRFASEVEFRALAGIVERKVSNLDRQLIEREQSVTRSEEAERLLKTAGENANDVILVSEAESNDSGPRVLYVNEAFTRNTGYLPSEIIGKSPRMLQGPDTCEETRRFIRGELKAWRPVRAELLNYRKDGSEYWVEINIRPVADANGWFTHWVSIQRDITERKRTEEALIQTAIEMECRNRELAEANIAAMEAVKLKSEFLANMSHEIRTPMNGILGMTNLLLTTGLDTQQKEFVSIVKASADALLSIVNDVLDFSKIESGKLTVESVRFSLAKVLEDISALLANRVAAKGQRLVFEYPEDFKSKSNGLLGDPGRFRQIITNLLGNAIKFTDDGGTIKIGAELIQDQESEQRWRVYVSDTGIGIPSDRQEAIFQSFTQADGSTTRRFGGTGLGLSISRQLAELMGGQITLQSELGRGSTFSVEITFKKQILAQTLDVQVFPTAHLRTSSDKPLRILLADDNSINQQVALHILRNIGVDTNGVVVVENGLDAISAVKAEIDIRPDERPFDIILMDIQMPLMDGFEAASIIRTIDIANDIPIIAMTAHAMAGDRERCLSGGMDDYITKPLVPSQFMALLALWTKPEKSGDTPGNEALDLGSLQQLCDGDYQFERSLLEEYSKTAPAVASRCQIMADAKDSAGLEHWAHKLKSSCKTIGARVLADYCQKLENYGRLDLLGVPDGAEEIEVLLNMFSLEVKNVQTAVGRRLVELAGSANQENIAA